MGKNVDEKIAFVALIAFAAWLFVVLPLLYLPSQDHVHGEILGVKDGEWLLFAATAVLAWTTWKLVTGAEKTAERQLRAYLYVEKTNLVLENGVWTHSFTIKNFGQTPAHKVNVTYETEAVDWNGGQPRIPVPGKREKLGSIAPNADFYDIAPRIIGNPDPARIVLRKDMAIYLVGKITYFTVFGNGQCETNFRYYVGGDTIYEGGEMYADDDGNDAT